MSIQFDHRDVQFATDEVDAPTDPEDVFDELVADPRRCCQRCYRRLRARRRFPDRAGFDHGHLLSFVDAVLPEGARWEVLDTEYFESVLIDDRSTTEHPPGERHTNERACGFCGVHKPHRSPSTRSRQAALEAALGISATLQEFGVAHNPLALLVEVGDLKRDPDTAGDDHATFSTATARAVWAGRR